MLDLPMKKHLRPDEVALYFDVSRSTVYLWVDHGMLDGCKLTNGMLRITRESVERMEEKGRERARRM
jgi:excisionase family DNA binding protein